MGAITELLDGSRLVTITGSGGVGKTRVAIEIASRMRADFQPRVGFVDVFKLSDGALVAEAVAAAIRPHRR